MESMCKFICIVIAFPLLFIACGDDSSGEFEAKEGYYRGVECPRLALESFDDCVYEPLESFGYLDLNSKESVADFCQSSCDQIEGVSGSWDDNSAEDVALLKGIKHITLYIHLEHMKNLKSLHGLENLESVGDRSLKLISNPKFESLEALSSLRQVDRAITIQANKNLKSLKGLEGLREIKGLRLDTNLQLSDITALYNVEELISLYVANSPDLPVCQVEHIQGSLSLSDEDITISNVGTGTCD